MRRTKEDAAITREQLLRAALVSFRSKGYINTTLDDIAKQAGTTRGAIHWHFGSKAELFNTMIRESYNRAIPAFQKNLVVEGSTPLQRLRRFMVRWMQYLEEDEDFRTVMEILIFKTEIVPELSSGMQENAAGRRVVHEFFTQLIRESIDAGEVRSDIDPDTAAIAGEGLLYGTITNWLSSQRDFSLQLSNDSTSGCDTIVVVADKTVFSLHDLAETIVDFYIRGLQAS